MDNAALGLDTQADNDPTQRCQLNKQNGVHVPPNILIITLWPAQAGMSLVTTNHGYLPTSNYNMKTLSQMRLL